MLPKLLSKLLPQTQCAECTLLWRHLLPEEMGDLRLARSTEHLWLLDCLDVALHAGALLPLAFTAALSEHPFSALFQCSVQEASKLCRHDWMREALHAWLRRQGLEHLLLEQPQSLHNSITDTQP